MLQLKYSLILLLILSLPLLDCRKVSSGGARGSSSRTHYGGGQPYGGIGQPHGGMNQPSGFKPGGYPSQQGGGYHQPPPNVGGSYGGNYHNGPYGGGGGFRGPQSNPGFSNNPKGNQLKYALIGGLGGALIGGLAVSALHRDQPIPVNGKEYYFDQQHFKSKADEFMCYMPFDDLKPNAIASSTTTISSDVASTNATTTITPEKALSQATFSDGTRPKHIVWACKKGIEMCCEGTCCPLPQNQLYRSDSTENGASKSNGGSSGAGIIVLFFLASSWFFYCSAAALA